VSKGVEPKAEITSDEEISENPTVDLPNQEKNQYRTIY